MSLISPTASEVKRVASEFLADRETAAMHEGVRLVFSGWPRNDDLPAVTAKVAVLDRVFGTNVYNIGAMAAHIASSGIDGALAAGDLDVVDRIARAPGLGKARRAYSFATKYAAMHRPDVFQIYDSRVECALWMLRKQTAFDAFRRGSLADYRKFMRVIETLRDAFGLHSCARLEIDRYLWTVGGDG